MEMTDQAQIQQLTAQLAAAREQIRAWAMLLPKWQWLRQEMLDWTPSPAADALLEDKARLDWLDGHAPIITYSTGKLNGPLREAIDAARKASTKEEVK